MATRIPVTFIDADGIDEPIGGDVNRTAEEQRSKPPVEPGEARPPSSGDAPDSTGGDGRRQTEKTRDEKLTAEELLDQYLRLKAEFANYKRRVEKEREKDRERGAEEAVRKILPALDGLVQALGAARARKGCKSIAEGIALTLAEMDKALDACGIVPMKTLGAPFDPRFHEALSAEPGGDTPPGIVVREVSPGYTKNGEMFRPARVVVSR